MGINWIAQPFAQRNNYPAILSWDVENETSVTRIPAFDGSAINYYSGKGPLPGGRTDGVRDREKHFNKALDTNSLITARGEL